MKDINLEIKNNFTRYKNLLETEKKISSSEINLHQKKNNRNWLTNTTQISHPKESTLNLTTEKQKFCTKYAIKLQCISLTKTPFFRFDSDGPAHRNKENSIALKNQLITTPHFNSFDKNGKPIAYKTPALKVKSESEAIVNNIEFGLNHFFAETNIKNNFSSSYIKVGIREKLQLFDDIDESDPLNHVDFII